MKNMVGKKITEVFQSKYADIGNDEYQVYYQFDHWSGGPGKKQTYFVVRQSDLEIVYQTTDRDEAWRKREELNK